MKTLKQVINAANQNSKGIVYLQEKLQEIENYFGGLSNTEALKQNAPVQQAETDSYRWPHTGMIEEFLVELESQFVSSRNLKRSVVKFARSSGAPLDEELADDECTFEELFNDRRFDLFDIGNFMTQYVGRNLSDAGRWLNKIMSALVEYPPAAGSANVGPAESGLIECCERTVDEIRKKIGDLEMVILDLSNALYGDGDSGEEVEDDGGDFPEPEPESNRRVKILDNLNVSAVLVRSK